MQDLALKIYVKMQALEVRLEETKTARTWSSTRS